MAASFALPPTMAEFHALVRGTTQEAGDLQRLTLGVYIDDPAQWANLQLLLTTKYHVHSPLGGDVVVDVVRGIGEGYLIVDDFGEGFAILVELQRNTYARANTTQTLGSATFLLTGAGF